MTKIYIYCLFDTLGRFIGVYSSLKAVHRDALRLANQGTSRVYLMHEQEQTAPTLTTLRNVFKGKCDVDVKYRTSLTSIRVYKTKLRE